MGGVVVGVLIGIVFAAFLVVTADLFGLVGVGIVVATLGLALFAGLKI